MKLKLPNKLIFSYDEFETVDLDSMDNIDTIEELEDLREDAYNEAVEKLEAKYGYYVDSFIISAYPTTRTVELEDIIWCGIIKDR